MRTLILVGLLSLTVGCASLRHADGTLNVIQILDDARWGLLAGCSQQWVPADACTFGLDTITLAEGIAQRNRDTSVAAVRQYIVDAEAKLPATSRLRPYLDAILALLVLPT